MNANEYQELAGRTLIDAPGFELTPEQVHLTETVLRVAASVGELADMLKKGVYHRHGLNMPRFFHQIEQVKMALGYFYLDPDRHGLTDRGTMLVWNALGLVGESGEVVSSVLWYMDEPVELGDLPKELGDTLWYIAALCSKLGLSLDEVMQANIEKLKKRYPEGYSSEASMQRVDVDRWEHDLMPGDEN